MHSTMTHSTVPQQKEAPKTVDLTEDESPENARITCMSNNCNDQVHFPNLAFEICVMKI